MTLLANILKYVKTSSYLRELMIQLFIGVAFKV